MLPVSLWWKPIQYIDLFKMETALHLLLLRLNWCITYQARPLMFSCRTVKKKFFILMSFLGFHSRKALRFTHLIHHGIINDSHKNYCAELIWMRERKMTFKTVLSLFLVHLMENPDKLNIGRAQSNQATKLCEVIGPSTNCISFGVLEKLPSSENNWVQEVLVDLRLESRVSYFDSTHRALPECLK